MEPSLARQRRRQYVCRCGHKCVLQGLDRRVYRTSQRDTNQQNVRESNEVFRSSSNAPHMHQHQPVVPISTYALFSTAAYRCLVFAFVAGRIEIHLFENVFSYIGKGLSSEGTFKFVYFDSLLGPEPFRLLI